MSWLEFSNRFSYLLLASKLLDFYYLLCFLMLSLALELVK